MTLAPALGRLGAPAILVSPPEAVGTISGVHRDVAAFFGVPTRGPCREPLPTLAPDDTIGAWLLRERDRRTVPVRVTSWDEYRHHFGGFEGPGRLPYAVSAFFDGGGHTAYVGRVVHNYGRGGAMAGPDSDSGGVAEGRFTQLGNAATDPIVLRARSEGSWGNQLSVTLRFRTRPLVVTAMTPTDIVVDVQEWVPGGSLLRLQLPGDRQELRVVERSEQRPDPSSPRERRHLTLDVAASDTPVTVEIVTGTIETVDLDPTFARREVVDDVGFRSDHPRWLARVLINESTVLWPAPEWVDDEIVIADARLREVALTGDNGEVDGLGDPIFDAPTMTGGQDRWHDVVPEDFHDPTWVLGNETPGDGVQCLADHHDVGLVLAPDLYEPAPLSPVDDVTDPPNLCGPEFAEHHAPLVAQAAVPNPIPLAGLALNPRIGADLDRIVDNQRALVDFAAARRDLTVLLDVPLGLAHGQILQWRNSFDSAYAAAYHPWLDVAPPDDGRDGLVRLNPSAFAAGIIAERERRLGVHFGPANQVAVGAVRTAADVPPARHDSLHVAGVNVFVPDHTGVLLTGARTLALRQLVRQLNVARLMTVLRLSLEREMQWAVFEPNNERLWAEIERRVKTFLTAFYDAGAFRGESTGDAFFVTCDRTTMSTNDLDNGRIICHVGVNVAEPIEYIVLEIALDADTTETRIIGT